MKKILVIAAAALAFAACTKSEVFNTGSAIDFAPSALSTKALVTGTTFPTDQTFNVFAFADLNDNQGIDYSNPVMNDVVISKATGDWKGVTTTAHPDPYMWTPTGIINFYAYYPSTLTATFSQTENADNVHKGLHLNSVDLGSTIGSQIDPLVACALSQSSEQKPTVAMAFKHITSQMAVYAYDATTIESLRGNIIITSVVFKNMKTVGTYTEGNVTGKGTWAPTNDVVNFTPYTNTSDATLATTETNLSENALFVVIPFAFTAADNVAIEVNYKTLAYTVNGFDYPATDVQTATIPLYGTYGNWSENFFSTGKRYVFHIGVTLDKASNEIVFAPSVDEWESVNIDGITIDAVHNTLI